MPAPRELWLRDPGHFFALGGGSGLLPKAPGTWGSLVGVALFVFLPVDSVTRWVMVVGSALGGIALCGRTGRAIGVKDHPAIVWDEIVGVMICLCLAAAERGGEIAAGFIAFRILDIWKPWPIGWLDRNLPGGVGVMADDCVAGGIAGVAILIFKYLSLG